MPKQVRFNNVIKKRVIRIKDIAVAGNVDDDLDNKNQPSAKADCVSEDSAVDEEEIAEYYNEEVFSSDDESLGIIVKRRIRFRFVALQHPAEFEALWERIKQVPLNLEPPLSTSVDDNVGGDVKGETLEEMLEIIRNKVDTSGDKIIEPEEVEETNKRETTNNTENGRSMTFTLKGKTKKRKLKAEQRRDHIEERKKLRRCAGDIMRRLKPLPRNVQNRPFFK